MQKKSKTKQTKRNKTKHKSNDSKSEEKNKTNENHAKVSWRKASKSEKVTGKARKAKPGKKEYERKRTKAYSIKISSGDKN